MAKKQRKKHYGRQEDLVQVDHYYIPADQADMYRALREVVREEVNAWAQDHYHQVEIVQDPQEGEGIVAHDENGTRTWYYWLHPRNISDAQKARDKDQLACYLSRYTDLIGEID